MQRVSQSPRCRDFALVSENHEFETRSQNYDSKSGISSKSGYNIPKSHHSIVREIQTLLLPHKHIHLRWLKAHVGYLGHECADQLAKEAITKGDPFLLPEPLSYLKAEIKSAALSIWQDNWDNGETGRSTRYSA
ncbi:hypothetical protein AVEN_190121-1 [Araneus ventricosus]|uniref:Uncharacterized protein n=1 Tax=Araneus ventricosus TaxID=182803 RepID=A0A4Y2UJU2_ARAVE|nr:hypothetical protein AVEN_190121-1 [Araneus ventricosus]